MAMFVKLYNIIKLYIYIVKLYKNIKLYKLIKIYKTIAANPIRSLFEKYFKSCFDSGFRIYVKFCEDTPKNHRFSFILRRVMAETSFA